MAAPAQTPNPQDARHQSETWRNVAMHLPDPATASPQALETQGDILRARRFPEDALTYYRYALERGGRQGDLLNKIGLTELELRNSLVAESYLKRAVKADKRNASAWNNLGAAEYLNGSPAHAASDYRHAIRLDRNEAVYHANLATVRFAQRSFGAGRREIATALRLDPKVFGRAIGAGGVAAHVLSAEERARLSLEMAKLYAQRGMTDEMFHALARASESGMNIRQEMKKDRLLAGFVADPRTLRIVQEAEALRTGGAPDHTPNDASMRAGVPPLPAAAPPQPN